MLSLDIKNNNLVGDFPAYALLLNVLANPPLPYVLVIMD
jgi:hypothetical protein